jgi:hypothetical protein
MTQNTTQLANAHHPESQFPLNQDSIAIEHSRHLLRSDKTDFLAVKTD